MTMANPVGSFIWYELMTNDPAGAKAFYDDVVGWSIADGPDSDASGIEYRHIKRGDGGFTGGVLKLSPEMVQNGAHPCWMGYLYVTDVDAEAAKIEGEGGRILMPASDVPGAGRIAMAADPQGVPIYIMTPKPPEGQEDKGSDAYDRNAVHHVSWNELLTPDPEGAKAFYSRHFGFEFNESMPMGEMGNYDFIDHGGEMIGAIMRKPNEMPMGAWNYYIHVADIDAATDKVKAGGGQVMQGPMEVPGGDWIINGIDPQGAMFSLVGSKRG
jgi:uncharacterized protein